MHRLWSYFPTLLVDPGNVLAGSWELQQWNVKLSIQHFFSGYDEELNQAIKEPEISNNLILGASDTNQLKKNVQELQN